MKLFTTSDVSKSVHAAHEQFTHIVLNRGYTLIRPVFFRTALLDDLPVHQYASWIPETESQLVKWNTSGGVLIVQDTHLTVPGDVTVMVECPYAMDRLERVHGGNSEYGVIPHPVSWSTHEQCVDLRFPPADLLEAIWRVCGGHSMTNSELSAETGIPVPELQYVKNALKPVEHWYIQKRLAPERDEFVPAWDWLEAGVVPKRAVSESGFKAQVEEMARFGYINLKRMQHYPADTPDWHMIDRKREAALSDLASVRALVESLPAHPEA